VLLLLLLLLSICGLFGLAVIVILLRGCLHLLDQISEEFLELLIFLPHIHDLSLDPLDSLRVATDLVLNLHNLFQYYLPYLIKTLHVRLLTLILLKRKLAFNLRIRRVHRLFDLPPKLLNPLNLPLLLALYLLLQFPYLIYYRLTIRILHVLLYPLPHNSFNVRLILYLGLQQLQTLRNILVSLDILNEFLQFLKVGGQI